MSDATAVLRDLYAALAELWCSPEDIDRDALREQVERTLASWERLDAAGAAALGRFLQAPVSADEYIELFELAPRCPLYLGSHGFDEPQTCAQAATSDRNGYMIELLGIYRHFGLTPNRSELPDYLPLVVEFLALSAGSEDPLRVKLVREYVLPFLQPMRARLETAQTPYLHLLDALERALRLDLEVSARGAPCSTSSSS